MYGLYFIEDGKEKLYGSGDIRYINELLTEYIGFHLEGKKKLSFTIKKLNFWGEVEY